ncbi:transcription-repair coupling factor [Bartonella tamiae]|uniref:Transcription-repair-coupling factor n=1 Tax=Bartonella tamiae Th239 TaxID=1094558 RepID=J0QZQ3_9HYPH|nr:transcription-repair coupling factor [Bartonella tamiae]EJF88729.1 transcription-repair coupling factor [Bartonella tamiae Th239]
MSIFKKLILKDAVKKHVIFNGVTAGYEPFLLAKIAAENTTDSIVVYIVRDGQRLADLSQAIRFIEPQLSVMEFPAWDCLPYDRVSPSSTISARRMSALTELIHLRKNPHNTLVLTTINSLIQKLPPPDVLDSHSLTVRTGQTLDMDQMVHRLERNGFERVATVREVGEFAIRGGILDLYAPGDVEPIRLDFFGDTLETIRVFDPTTQRTVETRQEFSLHAMSEITLTPETISQFRSSYISTFGVPHREDAFYEAISQGRRFAGMEHWLPLFYKKLNTFFDYVGNAKFVFENLAEEALIERHKLIDDYYQARVEQKQTHDHNTIYNPVLPNSLYIEPKTLFSLVEDKGFRYDLTPFSVPQSSRYCVVESNVKSGKDFVEERNAEDKNLFQNVVDYLAQLRGDGHKVMLAGWSEGSLERLIQVLDEHGLKKVTKVHSLQAVKATPRDHITAAVIAIEHGFIAEDLVVVTEQDILGDRLIRSSKRRKKNADFISEVSTINKGDIVVHVDHGIGRFIGLKTITAAGIPRDCLEIHYADENRLFLPVENIELLSRYGGESANAVLDKLGGVAWQARKAKLKKRLLEIAGQLIRIAAERAMRGAPKLIPPTGPYDEFVARFPYEETDDQLHAIDSVMDDLASGQPMDRLICGDVGFGKTEVAIRAAFVAALCGYQVAVVVPTTLLSRQHYKTFCQRFQGLPIKIGHASRLVGSKALSDVKSGVRDGTIDIVIGTHALLGSSIDFARLGLLIIDEEQHFGVKHKERLKDLKTDIHVLTLSATPIPRTLQLALTGVRELSLIASPPIDRMVVRTFISPFDPLIVRETLLREHYRGGQSFYVCPRISDLAEVHEFLQTQVPELKVTLAHGQMPPGQLDDIMNAFYDGQYDVLLSTSIVESGLDIPSANTLVVHRADMFGLSALYQLRGRVGRSKQRAYALYTLPTHKILTPDADRRLKVLQSLDTLGAGFQLASHDMDIRGAGNLLGQEQSGHIKEVGFELYQQMLEEAVAEIKDDSYVEENQWSPQISVGTAVMIPETYVPDLPLRMGLYRRLSDLSDIAEIDSFGAELIDRFGPMPIEVQHLLKVVYIKVLCRTANVEKLDAGPKGIVIHFRNNTFANGVKLIEWIGEQGSMAKIRADQSVVFTRDWPTAEKRLNGAASVMTQLVKFV